MTARLRSPLTLLVLCLQLVLAVRAPAAVVGASVADAATSAVAADTVSGHAHHHHGAPSTTPSSAADDAPDSPASPHDGHEGGGCHGGLPCCASTLLAVGVRDVTARQRLVSVTAPATKRCDPTIDRIALRQPPATAPPTLG